MIVDIVEHTAKRLDNFEEMLLKCTIKLYAAFFGLGPSVDDFVRKNFYS